MDDHYAPRPIARWYLIGAIASALFMVLACAGFIMDVATDPRQLPLDQRALVEARLEGSFTESGAGNPDRTHLRRHRARLHRRGKHQRSSS